MKTRPSILELSDSYKYSHAVQLPDGTEQIFSYLEPRIGGKYKEIVFFGLQYIIKEYLEGKVVDLDSIERTNHLISNHIGPGIFNVDGWRYILKVHDGKLPLKIRAVPEGTAVPEANALLTIENTDPKVPWLTNFVETLLVQLWYPCTVATKSREIKKTILEYLKETGDPFGIYFKLHDFGFRGVSSVESAGIGGTAHLVNFKGTDTLAALWVAANYYHEPTAGYSIPAMEHSTVTSWGKDNEAKAFENMMDKFPSGTIAAVSDSYNIYNACEHIWGETLKDKVLSRDGTIVVRPDSGDPSKVVTKVIEILGSKFGFETNAKGYKVLDKHIRVIQGDGINHESIKKILQKMKEHKLSADNIAFGCGGELLQRLNRDDQNFALKCSSIAVNGKDYDVSKNPLEDPMKKSKAGKLELVKRNGEWKTVRREEIDKQTDRMMFETVFENGTLLRDETLFDIRERAEIK